MRERDLRGLRLYAGWGQTGQGKLEGRNFKATKNPSCHHVANHENEAQKEGVAKITQAAAAEASLEASFPAFYVMNFVQ
jgi:hypothetical protein